MEVLYLVEKEQTEQKRRLDWHSGFEAGLHLVFRRYRGLISIEREHPLSEEPLRIDFLVVKKNKDVLIPNDIGRLFRMYNIIEYKNPNDELNIDVLWKTIGYACLYKSFGKTVNEIKAGDVTISIFRIKKPKKLFKELEKAGKQIRCIEPGVYEIIGLIEFPVSIIVMNELEDEELVALKIMKHKADEAEVRIFLQEASRLTEPGDKRYADAVLQISAGVNKGLYRRLRGEGMCEALREIMAEDLKEAEKIGEMRGVKIGEEQGVKIGGKQRDIEKITEMLKSGKTPEAIADFCNYPIELVKSINKELNKTN